MFLDLFDNPNLAFLIGNGINRYPDDPPNRSWNNLLKKIYNDLADDYVTEIPKGIHLTEFYELILLKQKSVKNKKDKVKDIRKSFLKYLDDWIVNDNHYLKIMNIIQKINVPVMTTNFDDLLEKATNAHISWTMKDRSKGFTSYYPWESYYSNNSKINPFNNFSIWHIHGQKHYINSLKLGIRNYLKMVNRAEKWLPSSKPENTTKKYFKTWLRLFFEKDLFIFGLGLSEQEIFLRWLLLERERYFRRNPKKRKCGWYVFIEDIDDKNNGKIFYLNNLGFEYKSFPTKKSFYEDFWRKTTIY